jgi:carbamoyltransferase
MLFVSTLRQKWRLPDVANELEMRMADRLNQARSVFPAVTHLDYSSRIQAVDEKSNPRFWKLIAEFKKITGCGMIVNTSFNVRGEPIVCSPKDAWRGFLRTEMDFLVMGHYVFDKKRQKEPVFAVEEKKLFEPD